MDLSIDYHLPYLQIVPYLHNSYEFLSREKYKLLPSRFYITILGNFSKSLCAFCWKRNTHTHTRARERRGFIPIVISFYCIHRHCSCQRSRALQLKRGHLVTFTIDALKIVPAFIRHYVDSAYALVSPDTIFSRHSLDTTANWRRCVIEDWRFQSFPMGSIECHESGS